MYGAFDAAGYKPIAEARMFRKKLNIVPVSFALFFPWVVFSLVFAVLSFYWHYKYPHPVYAFVAFTLMVIVMNGAFALEAFNKQVDEGEVKPTWYVFTFLSSLLAWILAVVLGDMNFFYNLQPFYDVVNLNMYDGVDPSRTQGVELMDAGRIIFTGRSTLDLGKSVGFRNQETYCVAPITLNQGNVSMKPLLRYDFWAVGMNCCGSGGPGEFRCGDYNDRRAHAGLRLLRDDQRPFFRLAVQQAEASYGIKAVHPVFLYWLADPSIEAMSYQENGFKYYFLGMFSHFSLQLFLVMCAVRVFKKMRI